jgi:transcriptional regulator with XRE-family HTH domain
MKDRILAFLQSENKSYAQFADEIGVQPSGISHILSGRNNPSLDFVIKMLHRYPSLSADWLLFGKGPMYRFISQPTLFDTSETGAGTEGELPVKDREFTDSDVMSPAENFNQPQDYTEQTLPGVSNSDSGGRKIERIVMFYTDKTFSEYKPS